MRGGKRPGAGRPKGSPNKVRPEVRLVARDFGPEAIGVLRRIMNDENTPAAQRISAAALLLDRAYGRALQPIDPALNFNPDDLSDDELVRIIRGDEAVDERDLH
jgi:hypothetical protein